MNGEKDLQILLSSMTAQLVNDVFVFATFHDRLPPTGLFEIMRFQEAEGTTLILPEDQAIKHGIDYEYPCLMITLNVHSSLDAVGFIAKISTALAQENMGVNPVAGFFHDHLFVPVGREQDALGVIERLRAEAEKGI